MPPRHAIRFLLAEELDFQKVVPGWSKQSNPKPKQHFCLWWWENGLSSKTKLKTPIFGGSVSGGSVLRHFRFLRSFRLLQWRTGKAIFSFSNVSLFSPTFRHLVIYTFGTNLLCCSQRENIQLMLSLQNRKSSAASSRKAPVAANSRRKSHCHWLHFLYVVLRKVHAPAQLKQVC